MHIIIPYSSSAINNFVGLFFPLSFLLSILLFSNKPLQFPKVYTYDYMTGETNISKFKTWHCTTDNMNSFHIWVVSPKVEDSEHWLLLYSFRSPYISLSRTCSTSWGNRFCVLDYRSVHVNQPESRNITQLSGHWDWPGIDRWSMQSPAPGCFWLKGAQIISLLSDGRISGKWIQGRKWPCSLPYGENVSIIGKDEANTIKKLKDDTEMDKESCQHHRQGREPVVLGANATFPVMHSMSNKFSFILNENLVICKFTSAYSEISTVLSQLFKKNSYQNKQTGLCCGIPDIILRKRQPSSSPTNPLCEPVSSLLLPSFIALPFLPSLPFL